VHPVNWAPFLWWVRLLLLVRPAFERWLGSELITFAQTAGGNGRMLCLLESQQQGCVNTGAALFATQRRNK
jgi:hypothetical protein